MGAAALMSQEGQGFIQSLSQDLPSLPSTPTPIPSAGPSLWLLPLLTPAPPHPAALLSGFLSGIPPTGPLLLIFLLKPDPSGYHPVLHLPFPHPDLCPNVTSGLVFLFFFF